MTHQLDSRWVTSVRPYVSIIGSISTSPDLHVRLMMALDQCRSQLEQPASFQHNDNTIKFQSVEDTHLFPIKKPFAENHRLGINTVLKSNWLTKHAGKWNAV